MLLPDSRYYLAYVSVLRQYGLFRLDPRTTTTTTTLGGYQRCVALIIDLCSYAATITHLASMRTRVLAARADDPGTGRPQAHSRDMARAKPLGHAFSFEIAEDSFALVTA